MTTVKDSGFSQFNKTRGSIGTVEIKSVSAYKKPFAFNEKIYVLLESLSDNQIGAEEKRLNHKSYVFIVSRDQGETWKFLPENYYLGYGRTENGVGFINEHSEVLPSEVWSHFYRKLDADTYK